MHQIRHIHLKQFLLLITEHFACGLVCENDLSFLHKDYRARQRFHKLPGISQIPLKGCRFDLQHPYLLFEISVFPGKFLSPGHGLCLLSVTHCFP